MKPRELVGMIRNASCRVLGAEDASNDAQRAVLGALISGCRDSDATILCEPSLARKTTRPPDVVLVDLVAGVHIIEVKGVSLDQIDGIEPGGQFRISYGNPSLAKNPFPQVRNAMFDVKDAVERSCPSQLILPFQYWVVLSNLTRNQWLQKWGSESFCPPELLFADDLTTLAQRLRSAGQDSLARHEVKCWPTEQIQAVWHAFGDSSVLFPRPEERQPRKAREGTLGEHFDESAEAYKALSDEQQRLSSQAWKHGPRLVRGVAGRGKTLVLANNLARRIQRTQADPFDLFENAPPPRFAAICFNRTLVPFIAKKVDIAHRQRTGRSLPEGLVQVTSYNGLMWELAQQGMWRYQKIDRSNEASRAQQYLKELLFVKQNDPATFERFAFDAIYIDEGQDFSEEDFRLLKELCRTPATGDPSLFVFYDDAQNLYGRQRPNWQSLGLNLVGRSHIMSECFRNTRPIVEATFNVLYGSFAEDKSQVPTKAFVDIRALEEKKLLTQQDGVWRVGFVKRNGLKPKVTVATDRHQQWSTIVQRLRWLTVDQEVRPEDIHVLAYYKNQVDKIVAAVETARIPTIAGVHVATTKKDELLQRRGWLSVSTVASAKGYDAYCVLVASGNDFPTDVQGRASFYVACTRAIEYLELFASERRGLVSEMEQAIAAL
jgi:hypothetical protein